MQKVRFPRDFIGVLLLIFGFLLLVTNFIPRLKVLWSLVWPVVIFVPGCIILYFWLFSKDKKKSFFLLIPSTILIIISLILFLNMIFTVIFRYSLIWVWTIFAYPGAVAVSLWVSSLYSSKRKILQTASKVLGIIALIVFLIIAPGITILTLLKTDLLCMFWPIVIICPGILLLLGPFWHVAWRRRKMFGRKNKEWKEWGESFGKKVEKSVKDTLNPESNKRS